MEQIYHILKEGGWPMYINVFVVSVVSLAVVLERLVALFLQFRINPENFTNTMINLVKQGNLDRALKYCASTKLAIARVCRAGLLKANKGIMDISAGIDEEMMRVTPHLEKRIASLWALANIATLMGLIGTIFGLITSFKGLEGVSPEEKTAFLSRGISEALNNTAIGLTIAVCCMTGHLILSNISKKLVNEIEINAVTLENFLIQRLSAGKVDQAAAPEGLRPQGESK
ncbi:MAG: MotA/TolQ/ExbB proton channel family protein [Myxococcota bacterium]|jgi:biopolymer transport protein ExbB/TolQ|nr:MotA/TolQ/ExbB proton channel family protein [Myxococcota bacterium]